MCSLNLSANSDSKTEVSYNELSRLRQSQTGDFVLFKLLIISKNYCGMEIPNEGWLFQSLYLNLMRNLQTWFRTSFFCESGFLELIFLRSQNLSEAPLYRISLQLLLPSSVQGVLITGQLIFKPSYNTVVCRIMFQRLKLLHRNNKRQLRRFARTKARPIRVRL